MDQLAQKTGAITAVVMQSVSEWQAMVSSMLYYSDYVKERAVYLFMDGKNAPAITKALCDESHVVLRVSIHKLLIKYRETGTVARQQVSGWPSNPLQTVDKVIENQMRVDDETIAAKL